VYIERTDTAAESVVAVTTVESQTQITTYTDHYLRHIWREILF